MPTLAHAAEQMSQAVKALVRGTGSINSRVDTAAVYVRVAGAARSQMPRSLQAKFDVLLAKINPPIPSPMSETQARDIADQILETASLMEDYRIPPTPLMDIRFRDEFWLLLGCFSWGMSSRVRRWHRHVSKYAAAKGETRSVDKIDHLWKHLDVIDDKVSRLLTFLGALSITTLLTSVHVTPTTPHSLTAKGWWFLGAALFATWLAPTLLCISAAGRVLWGEFSEATEKKDLNDFITAVIKRTAKYRVALRIAFVEVILAALVMVLIFWSSTTSPTDKSGPQPTPTVDVINRCGPSPIYVTCPGPPPMVIPAAPNSFWQRSDIGPFPKGGAACERLPYLDRQIKAAEDQISGAEGLSSQGASGRRPPKVRVIGFSDGSSVSSLPDAKKSFVSNEELAYQRAKCVSDKLKEALNDLSITMEVSINEDIGRVTVGKPSDNPDLRHVAIYSQPGELVLPK